MMRLTDRTAIITGAGRGIGRATALALVAEGCRVVLAARTSMEIDAVAGEVRAAGGNALAVPCDVSREEDVRRLVDEAVREFGALHIVVNNAGDVCRAPVIEMAVEDWDRVLNSQLRGTFMVTRFA